MSERLCIRRTVDIDHPCLAGHFPGNPIVPATLLLEEVIEAFSAWKQGYRVTGVGFAKFTAVLRPQQEFTISVCLANSASATFGCAVDGVCFARGSIDLVALHEAKA